MKRYIIQIFWVLYFYLLGIGISFLIGGWLPGSVIGMVLLYATLELGWLKPDKVDRVSDQLIKYMVLFFIPPSIGIMAAWDRVAPQIIAIATAMVISTVLVIGAVALTQQYLEKRWRK